MKNAIRNFTESRKRGAAVLRRCRGAAEMLGSPFVTVLASGCPVIISGCDRRAQSSDPTKVMAWLQEPDGIARASKVGMRNTFTSTIALATQLAAASFGCGLIVAPALNAQTTADQNASTRKADRQLMQKIRKAVIADKSLSTTAHNVNITSQDGQVTLRGTVKSDDEKKTVEDKATEIAGQGKVTNELTVAPSK